MSLQQPLAEAGATAEHLPYAPPYAYRRRPTREVLIGNVGVGGSNPIRVQSMTTTRTQDVEGTIAQVRRLVEVGCEIVRITAPTVNDARAIGEIRRRLRAEGIEVPLVADIHFSPAAALEAADVPYEIVPGVTAALAAAAEIGTSLTQRGSVRSFTFATPRSAADEGASQWISSVNAADASALYMGAREAPALAAALLAAGRSTATPVAMSRSMPDIISERSAIERSCRIAT